MRLTRSEIAARVAQDIPDGSYVNLGIGVPTLVADFLPEGREIVLHTENGMLGMGRAAELGEEHPDLINAGKVHVVEEQGASYFHHADSFALMRGGHIDYCVMGAYQVSSRGDLANWRTNADDAIPGVGGAMDLAAGARRVYIVMELFTKTGESKLLDECTYPLTARECVDRIYTDVAVFELLDGEVRVLELFDAADVDELAARVGVELIDATAATISA
ncbi:3-oxoacid CoA-transferase subunit B [Diaminobutyricimonas sp. LJ205]|uniref:3-oxoacid CoA-transferase subunit B n=1 Tax=Diaminobutyricimonas sp. LJ205 TaxID=2683590 RepID=UPI0012F4CBE1|nr:3-oxoacid CoA-transferase subunit B [Diaminobutyricimonas sp. LJ205]